MQDFSHQPYKWHSFTDEHPFIIEKRFKQNVSFLNHQLFFWIHCLRYNLIFFLLINLVQKWQGKESTRKVNSSSFSDRISTDEGRRKTCLSILSVLIWLWIFFHFFFEKHTNRVYQAISTYPNLQNLHNNQSWDHLLSSNLAMKKRDGNLGEVVATSRDDFPIFFRKFWVFMNFPSNIDLKLSWAKVEMRIKLKGKGLYTPYWSYRIHCLGSKAKQKTPSILQGAL